MRESNTYRYCQLSIYSTFYVTKLKDRIRWSRTLLIASTSRNFPVHPSRIDGLERSTSTKKFFQEQWQVVAYHSDWQESFRCYVSGPLVKSNKSIADMSDDKQAKVIL